MMIMADNLLLLKLVAELKLSEFDNACEKAGITEEEKKLIVGLIEEVGV
jgi:hypothetical protein